MASPSSSTILLRNGTVLIHDSNDHVVAHYNTDILVANDIITDIGSNLSAPSDAKVINCSGKIITPGFVDTHHHLWQTQMKGRHADEQLLDYMGSGNMQSYSYTPSDSYWGQLSGSLEALDAGTTTVLDHSHGTYTLAHAEAILSATRSSGLRIVFALAPIMCLANWNEDECIPSQNLTVEWVLEYLEKLLQQSNGKPLDGRVYPALGFDFYFLPKDYVISIFQRVRAAGVQLITTHVARNLVFGDASTTHLLESYGLLDKDILVSHATGIDEAEKKVLFDKKVFISSTPETECQMALGWPLALDDHVHGCLGIDCHTNNSSSIVVQARMALQMARQKNSAELAAAGQFPRRVRGSSEEAFNLATIQGARALGLDKEIGRIEKGMKADLVVWAWEESVGMLGTGDPLVAVIRHSDARDVEHVIVGGRLVKEAGKLSDVEIDGNVAGVGAGKKALQWTEVAKEVRKSREALYKRMDKCNLDKAREMLVGTFGLDDAKLV